MIRDSCQYVVRENVPILDEHVLYDEDGKVIATIDADRLLQIAENNNKRVKETGDEVPLIIGHTEDGKDEAEQPEIVGWASDFKVSRLFNTGRKAIFATFKYLKDKADVIRKYPRRSVELWLRKWEIDPISLLGATTPERSLGLLRYQKQDGLHYKHLFSAKGYQTNMDPKQIVQMVLQALSQLPEWKVLQSIVADQQGPQGQPAKGPAQYDSGFDDETVDYDDEDDSVDYDGEEDLGAVDYDGEDQSDVQYEASGTNTFTPSGLSANRAARSMNKKASSSAKASMARKDRSQVARYEARLSQQEKAINGLVLRLRRAERERDLIQLESEGYVFDRDEELDRLSSLNPKGYAKALDIIRRRYQRSPISASLSVLDHASYGHAKTGRSRDEALALAEKALAKGKSYESVLED